MQSSVFRPVSMGRVAENKDLEKHIIEVIPVEIMPMADGVVDSKAHEVEEEYIDIDGRKHKINIKHSLSIEATWIPFGSNRVTAADVRVRERVLIQQCADSDKYYWKETGLDDHLRCLETVIYAWSNNSEDGVDHRLSLENCYYLEVSTHESHITLGTSKSNGEAFAYTAQIDGKNSLATITDDVGNTFQINSADGIVTLKNEANTLVELDKKVLNLFSVDTINVDTNVMNVNVKQFNLTSDKSHFDTPTTTFAGNVKVTGSFTYGSAKGGGLVASSFNYP